jgi:hypothetical protein
MTRNLEDLRATLIRHFIAYGGVEGHQRAEHLANLAISGIGVAYPEGWEIIPERTELEGVLVQGDGIEDGISRLELISTMTSRDETPGEETEVSYRGETLEITYGIGDTYLLVKEVPFSPAFRVADTDRGGEMMQFLRDLDLFIDVVRAERDDGTNEGNTP